jgi:hypothetical protein
MLSKEERKLKNQQFWSGFQSFMGKTRSVNGRKMNWINYPSDIKDIHIRLEVDSKFVRLCFDIQGKDPEIRALIYEQMTELKLVLETETIEKPHWEETYTHLGKTISRIYWERKGLNYFLEKDQEQIYIYLKERLLRFDAFYQEYKEILIALAK